MWRIVHRIASDKMPQCFLLECPDAWEHSGDHNQQDFPISIAMQNWNRIVMQTAGAPQDKREEHTESTSLSSGLWASALVIRPKYPPISRDSYSNTVSSAVSQTIAARPPLLSVKLAYRNPKTALGGGVSQKKLAPEAYRVIAGHRMK